MSRSDLLHGTLQLLILKTLELQPLHGLGLVRRIEQVSRGRFRVSLGALFPALHRMENEGWIVAKWGPSESNRRAKYYALTAAGRRQLKVARREWEDVVDAIGRVLEAT